MENQEAKEMMEERVPSVCPFCDRIDQVDWTEFKVNLIDVVYVDEGEIKKEAGIDIQVFCSRCLEEIRKEDVE